MISRNWTKLYNTYTKKYELIKSKSPVDLEPKYTQAEFKMMYRALEEERNEEILAGTRHVLNITQDLVHKQQMYKYSMKQARAIRTQLNNNSSADMVRLTDIRTGKVDTDEFWNAVSEAYNTYSINMRANEAKKRISQVFFGST